MGFRCGFTLEITAAMIESMIREVEALGGTLDLPYSPAEYDEDEDDDSEDEHDDD
jgi:hypothetical protein